VQKPGINYPDLEPGNEFLNRVRVPSSCYKSLQTTMQNTHFTSWVRFAVAETVDEGTGNILQCTTFLLTLPNENRQRQERQVKKLLWTGCLKSRHELHEMQKTKQC